jgi:uncharacterized protein
MKKVLLLSILIVFMSFNLSALTKKDKIIQLFGLMNSDKMINNMVDNMSKMFQNQSSELKNAMNDSIQQKYFSYVFSETKEFSKKLFNEDMVTIYDKYFTETEIQKYIDFYNSPEGKKFVEQSPSVQNDLMTNVINNYLPDLKIKFKNKLDELNKK